MRVLSIYAFKIAKIFCQYVLLVKFELKWLNEA